MMELTGEEKEMLAELDKQQIIYIRARKHGQTDEDRRRLNILKGLVYKDQISFSALPAGERNYVFISRSTGNSDFR